MIAREDSVIARETPMSTLMRMLPHDPEKGGSRVGWHFISTWKKCQMLWWNVYGRPHALGGTGHVIRESPGDARALGTVIHAALEAWYTHDYSLDAAMAGTERAVARYDWWPADTRAEMLANAVEVMQRHHAYCGPEGTVPETDRYVVARDATGPLVERTFEIPLAPDHPTLHEYVFTAKTDLVVTEVSTGRLWPMDHKSCNANTKVGLEREYRLSGQASGQLWVLRQLWPTANLGHGGLCNAVIKGAGRGKPPREIFEVPRSTLDLDVFAHTTLRTLVAINAAVEEWYGLVDAGQDPDAAALLVFDSYPDAYTCAGKWSPCDFFGACSHRDASGSWLASQTTPRHITVKETPK